MALVLNPWVLPWALAMVACFGAAVAILLVAPRRPQNQWLAWLLFAEGFGGFGVLIGLTDDADLARAGAFLQVLGTAMFLPGYPMFLGTLDTWVSRPFQHRSVRIVLGAFCFLYPLFMIALPHRYLLGVDAAPESTLGWAVSFGPWFYQQYYPAIADYLLGLLVTIAAFLAAQRGTVKRERAKAYALAFGVYDGYWLGLNLAIALVLANGGLRADVDTFLTLVASPVVNLVWVALLARGILRTQLFDIDLRIKKGIQRGTLAAAFIVVFVVVSEVVQSALSARYGLLAGALAAGVLLLALEPLQRASRRIADGAMPRVQPSAEYIAYRKLEVYRAAVESALETGDISPKERDALTRLAAKLAVRPPDAEAVETDVRARLMLPSGA